VTDPHAVDPHDPDPHASDLTPDLTPDLKGLDLDAVAAYLHTAAPILDVVEPLSARLIAGGLSNLTFELSDASGRSWVLRRPPLGHVLPTAHDMRREFRVISALHGTIPVARPYVLCEDADVIGASFYVMELVEGTVLRSREQCAALTPDRARRTCENLVDVLAALHAVDPAAVGLADFGRPEGYLHRQLDRWNRQYAASQSREVRGLFELAEGLRGAVPVTQRSTILHGDYRLDNVMVGGADGEQVTAVFDWEMSTLGDPLADLALLLTYWEDPGRPAKQILAEASASGGGLTNHPGFLSSRDIVERYATATGLIVDDLDWYIAMSHYKLAVILEGIYYRHTQGLTYGEGFERAGGAVAALVENGRSHLDLTR
jgi:aminoglycoside phosphotransferase (APT) family kinase protein